MLKRLPFAAIVGGVLFCAHATHATIQTEAFTGSAFDSSGQLAYIEKHEVKYVNGTVVESRTLYLDQNRRIIGRLISEYSQGPQYGSYEFQDVRARYENGAKVTDDRIWLYRRESPANGIEKSSLPRRDNQIVGQGFHQFLRTQLESIAAGTIIQVQLVLPSRLNQYQFRIRKLEIAGDVLSIRLEIDNWFLRLFAPHVDADYDLKTRRLLRYEGISNLTDPSGQYKNVTIDYNYSG